MYWDVIEMKLNTLTIVKLFFLTNIMDSVLSEEFALMSNIKHKLPTIRVLVNDKYV